MTYLTETLAAAKAGAGIAMGWQMLLGDALDSGALVKLGTVEMKPELGHHLIAPLRHKASLQVELVKTWLARELTGP